MELKRLKILGLLVMAVMTVTAAITAASASAEVTLPQFSVAAAALGSGGKSTLTTVGGKTVTSTNLTVTTSPENTRLGTFTIDFFGVTDPGITGSTCNSLGDLSNKGLVLVHGTYHVVEVTLTHLFLLLLLLPVHYFCLVSGVSVLLLDTGDILLLIEPVGKKVKTTEHFTLTVKQSGGKQEFKEYETDSGGKATTLLLTAEGTGSGEESGQETENGQLTPTVEGELKGE